MLFRSKGDAHVELVWIPIQTFDNIGKPGSDFYPVPLPSPTPEEVAAAFQDPDRPSSSLRNSAYGLRANTLVGGWDLASFYYRSYGSSPTFYREATGNSAQPFVFAPRYDRIWQVGATFSKDLGSIALHGEAVYAHGQRFATLVSTATDGIVERPTLDWILGADIPFTEMEGRVNLQVFQRRYFGDGADAVALDAGDFGVSVLVSAKVTNAFEPQILWVQTFGGGGSLVRPRLNWYPEKNTTVGFGVDIFTGASNGYFGRYDNRDRGYAELRYSF